MEGSTNNTWDNGYPSGGNCWSDYIDVDEKSGPNQDQLRSDGIGDTLYVIDENNQDRYPLMNPHIPELPSTIPLPLYGSLSVVAVILANKKFLKAEFNSKVQFL